MNSTMTRIIFIYYLLLEFTPNIEPSKFINILKTVSSRLIRKKYSTHLDKYYWKPYFWSRSYCLISTGGASIDIIKNIFKIKINVKFSKKSCS
uniref:IS200/IS605 family transposase n=2 Tax=Borrelia recurrentis TaxID=44449 RepID=UPI002FBE0F08